jgi:hypothetical protein
MVRQLESRAHSEHSTISEYSQISRTTASGSPAQKPSDSQDGPVCRGDECLQVQALGELVAQVGASGKLHQHQGAAESAADT